MTFYTFGPFAVYDTVSNTVLENATGGKLVAAKDDPAIPIYDLNQVEIPGDEITSNAAGQSSMFLAEDVLSGLAQFGDVCVTVFANEVAQYALEGHSALAQATDAAASAAAAAAAAQAAQAAAESAQAGGLDPVALQALIGGDPSNLIGRMMLPWLRDSSGNWPSRPTCLVAVAIGTAPQPVDLQTNDMFWQTS